MIRRLTHGEAVRGIDQNGRTIVSLKTDLGTLIMSPETAVAISEAMSSAALDALRDLSEREEAVTS